MNNPTPKNKADAGEPLPPAAEPVKRPWTPVRVVVLGAAAIATAMIIITGLFWGYYRLGHTVIHNASVKGRVYKIGARIDGQIKSVEVLPGEHVVQGQVLIRLVDDHIQAAVSEARAQLKTATTQRDVEKLAIEQQRRQLTLEVERCETVSNAAASDLDAATSTADRWQNEYDRDVSLVKVGVTSESEMDTATAQRDNARALVKVAQGHLATAASDCQLAVVQLQGLHVREAGLDVLSAQVDLARQQLALAEADLAATVIRAPASGWVVDRIVEPAGSAKVGEPMMSLWLGQPWVEAWVDEKKLARIRIGSPVDVSLTAFPGRKLRGNVEAIGVLTDTELQNSPVPTTLHSLFSGQRHGSDSHRRAGRSSPVAARLVGGGGHPRFRAGDDGHGEDCGPSRQLSGIVRNRCGRTAF